MRIPVLLLTCLFLSSCVVTQQDLQMQRDLMETKRRLDEAERALKELQDDTSGGVRAHVETLARNQADFQAELDGVRVDLQSMQGNSSDQARINDDLSQELALLRDELSLQVSDHDTRLAQLESVRPAAVEATTDSKPAPQTTTIPPTATPAVAAPPVVAPVVEPAPAPAATPIGESAPELYGRALNLIRQDHQFAEGRELMQLFLKRYPDDSLAVNAAYWVGETYYAEKTYDEAILQFEEIIQKDGEHPKVAAATLKQALAFEALGDTANATLLLKRVVERFPLSDEATKAKEKLQSAAK